MIKPVHVPKYPRLELTRQWALIHSQIPLDVDQNLLMRVIASDT